MQKAEIERKPKRFIMFIHLLESCRIKEDISINFTIGKLH